MKGFWRIRQLVPLGLLAAGFAVWTYLSLSRPQMEPFLAGFSLVAMTGILFLLFKVRSWRKPQKDLFVRAEALAEQGRRLAIYDTGSGVLARWYFELRLEEEARRSQRYEQPMALVTVTCTGAAKRQGVPAGGRGDDDMSRLAGETARDTDLVARLDLNTVAICLTQTQDGGALSLLRRLMDRMGPGDYSVGIALAPRDGCDAGELLASAARRAAPWRSSVSDRPLAA